MRLCTGRRYGRLLLCILLSLLIGFTYTLPLPVSGASSSDMLYQDYIYYTVSEKGEVTIKSARASIVEAVIPETIDGCPVTAVENHAFRDCSKLTTLILPDSVRKIGDYAFSNCKKLKTLYIPDTVEDVGWGIVQGTLWLSEQTDSFVVVGQGILLAYTADETEVIVPDTVRVIGGFAFSDRKTAEIVRLPASLTLIDAFAFDNCKNLRQIEMPDSLTAIREYAFHSCISLTDVTIPDNVKVLENHAFSFCRSLESVRLSASLQQLDNAVFSECRSLKTVEIPDSVRVIYNYVFQNCTALESIELPESVGELGQGAFDGCTSLQQVTIRNPICRIYDDAQTMDEAVVIHGMVGSTAKVYAQKYERCFRAFGQLRGDFDRDGNITSQDAFQIFMIDSNYAMGISPELTINERYAADFDMNEDINSQDAYQVLLISSQIAMGNNSVLERL